MATFLKLHHGFLDHEKHAELSNDALMLHISGLMYSSERLTDGRLSKAPAVRLVWSARLAAGGADVDRLICELIDAGVWVEWPDRYEISKFADHNRTRAQVDEHRASDRRRKRAQREKTNPSSDTDTDTEVRCDSERIPNGVTAGHSSDNVTSLRAARGGAA